MPTIAVNIDFIPAFSMVLAGAAMITRNRYFRMCFSEMFIGMLMCYIDILLGQDSLLPCPDGSTSAH